MIFVQWAAKLHLKFWVVLKRCLFNKISRLKKRHIFPKKATFSMQFTSAYSKNSNHQSVQSSEFWLIQSQWFVKIPKVKNIMKLIMHIPSLFQAQQLHNLVGSLVGLINKQANGIIMQLLLILIILIKATPDWHLFLF